MRPCIVHPNPGPGCETFIAAHVEGLAHEPLVLHGGHMPLFRRDGSPLFPGLPAEPGLLFSPTGRPETDLHERAADGLARLLAASGIDVLLAEYGPTGVALLEPCRRANIPLVAHFHGFDASLRAVLDKYRQGYARLFRQAAMIVAVSAEMRADLLALGADPRRLAVCHYGVDLARFREADPEAAPPRFVAVGRFVDKKAPETTLEAFAKVAALEPGAELVMIGDGVLRETCLRRAGTLGLDGRAHFPGRLEHAEVARVMRGSRAFVQHSRTAPSGDKEGLPNAVLEASACGLPVIATRHAGIPEAVVHGETGLLCAEGDVAAMAEHMLRLARDPAEAARLGRAGRARMERLFAAGGRLAELAALLAKAALAGHIETGVKP